MQQTIQGFPGSFLASLLAREEQMGQQREREVVLLGIEASRLALLEPGELVLGSESGLDAPAMLVEMLDRVPRPSPQD